MDRKDNRKKKMRADFSSAAQYSKKVDSGMSDDEIRSRAQKKKTKHRKLRRSVYSALAVLVIISLAIVLVFALFFKVGDVVVTGECAYSKSMVVENSGIVPGKNMFFIDPDETSSLICNRLPYIKEAVVERDFPDTMIIKVTPATEAASIEGKNGYIILDTEGKVLSEDRSILSESVPPVKGFKATSTITGRVIEGDVKKVEALIGILGAVEKAGLKTITEIDISKLDDIRITHDNRIILLLGNAENVQDKLGVAAVAVEKENELNPYEEGVLDLRNGKTAVFESVSIKNEAKNKDKNTAKEKNKGTETQTAVEQ